MCSSYKTPLYVHEPKSDFDTTFNVRNAHVVFLNMWGNYSISIVDFLHYLSCKRFLSIILIYAFVNKMGNSNFMPDLARSVMKDFVCLRLLVVSLPIVYITGLKG